MPQQQFDEAVRLEETGQTDRALAVWRELVVSTPTRNVYLRLAGCANKLGMTEQARDAFEKALTIDPGSVRALVGLGILAIVREDYSTAERYLLHACELEQDPGTLTLLGFALSKLGDDEGAEAAYLQAVRLDPSYAEAYFNLGVLVQGRRPDEAAVFFQRASEIDPDFAVPEMD